MKYWIRINKQSVGPAGPEHVRLIPGVTEDSFVCLVGSASADDWQRLRDVPELFQAMQEPALALSPLVLAPDSPPPPDAPSPASASSWSKRDLVLALLAATVGFIAGRYSRQNTAKVTLPSVVAAPPAP